MHARSALWISDTSACRWQRFRLLFVLDRKYQPVVVGKCSVVSGVTGKSASRDLHILGGLHSRMSDKDSAFGGKGKQIHAGRLVKFPNPG